MARSPNHDDFHVYLGRVKREADRRGLALGEVMRAAGLPPGLAEAWRRGERPMSLGDLHRLCDALGVDRYWLITPRWRPGRADWRLMGVEATRRAAEIEDVVLFLLRWARRPLRRGWLRRVCGCLPEADSATIAGRMRLAGPPASLIRRAGPPLLAVQHLRADAIFYAWVPDRPAGSPVAAICVEPDLPGPRMEAAAAYLAARWWLDDGQGMFLATEDGLAWLDWITQPPPDATPRDIRAARLALEWLVPARVARAWAVDPDPATAAAVWARAHGRSPEVVAEAMLRAEPPEGYRLPREVLALMIAERAGEIRNESIRRVLWDDMERVRGGLRATSLPESWKAAIRNMIGTRFEIDHNTKKLEGEADEL